MRVIIPIDLSRERKPYLNNLFACLNQSPKEILFLDIPKRNIFDGKMILNIEDLIYEKRKIKGDIFSQEIESKYPNLRCYYHFEIGDFISILEDECTSFLPSIILLQEEYKQYCILQLLKKERRPPIVYFPNSYLKGSYDILLRFEKPPFLNIRDKERIRKYVKLFFPFISSSFLAKESHHKRELQIFFSNIPDNMDSFLYKKNYDDVCLFFTSNPN